VPGEEYYTLIPGPIGRKPQRGLFWSKGPGRPQKGPITNFQGIPPGWMIHFKSPPGVPFGRLLRLFGGG